MERTEKLFIEDLSALVFQLESMCISVWVGAIWQRHRPRLHFDCVASSLTPLLIFQVFQTFAYVASDFSIFAISEWRCAICKCANIELG